MKTKEEYTEYLEQQMETGELETSLTAEEIVEHAFQLTAYQHGCEEITEEDLEDYVVNDIMDDPDIDEINEYLEDAGYYDDKYYQLDTYTLDDMMYGMKASDIIQQWEDNNNSWSDELFQWTIYGIETCSEDDAHTEWDEDTKRWQYENDTHNDYTVEQIKDDADIIIKVCNDLITMGY